MSQVDFAAMTLDEAKRYFLDHRNDQEAFHAYMDKLQTSGRAIVIDPDKPESETAAIAQMQKLLGVQT
jgi:hypothetical protein